MYTLILLIGIAIGAIATWRLAMSRAAAWVQGCQQGREDMMYLTRALGHKTVPPELPKRDRAASHRPGRSKLLDH